MRCRIDGTPDCTPCFEETVAEVSVSSGGISPMSFFTLKPRKDNEMSCNSEPTYKVDATGTVNGAGELTALRVAIDKQRGYDSAALAGKPSDILDALRAVLKQAETVCRPYLTPAGKAKPGSRKAT